LGTITTSAAGEAGPNLGAKIDDLAGVLEAPVGHARAQLAEGGRPQGEERAMAGWEAVAGPPRVYGQLESDEDCDEGFFWTTAYSAYCPEGDGGMVCVCDVTRRIMAEEFEQARQRGWR
jgi:hypothetical protein